MEISLFQIQIYVVTLKRDICILNGSSNVYFLQLLNSNKYNVRTNNQIINGEETYTEKTAYNLHVSIGP